MVVLLGENGADLVTSNHLPYRHWGSNLGCIGASTLTSELDRQSRKWGNMLLALSVCCLSAHKYESRGLWEITMRMMLLGYWSYLTRVHIFFDLILACIHIDPYSR